MCRWRERRNRCALFESCAARRAPPRAMNRRGVAERELPQVSRGDGLALAKHPSADWSIAHCNVHSAFHEDFAKNR
jgi:hypothetical protein